MSLGGAAGTIPAAGQAAVTTVLEVTRLADDHDPGSLRWAVDEANLDQDHPYEIRLGPGVHELDRCDVALPAPINTAGQLHLSRELLVRIVGAGPATIIRQTCAGQRVLQLTPTPDWGLGPSLVLEDLVIEGGDLVVPSSTGEDRRGGGGLAVDGFLHLERVTVRDNHVGVVATPPTPGQPGVAVSGGGIDSYDVVAVDSVVEGNSVTAGDGSGATGGAAVGGGIATAHATLTNTAVVDNVASGGDGIAEGSTTADGGDASGAGIHAAFTLTMQRGLVAGNVVRSGDASAPFRDSWLASARSARGGGISVGWPSGAADGHLSLVGTTVDANEARAGEGGWPQARGGGIWVDGTAELDTATVTANRAPSRTLAELEADARGGGVAATGDVLVRTSTVAGNESGSGGAIWSGATVLANQATFDTNAARFEGSYLPARGGAIEAQRAIVERSTFTANVADYFFDCAPPSCGGGPDTRGTGGAVFAREAVLVGQSSFVGNAALGWGSSPLGALGGAVSSEGAVSASNSTFQSNSSTARGFPVEAPAGVPAHGAAIAGATISTSFVTVTDSAGASAFERGYPVVWATALVDTRATVVDTVTGGTVCGDGAVTTSAGANWTSDDSCELAHPDDTVGSPGGAGLGPLAGSGPGGQVRIPDAASPVLDAVPPGLCTAAFDQRSVPRPQGTSCDIGAVEVGDTYPPGGRYHPLTPARLLDTRTDPVGPLGPGARLDLDVVGRGGVPDNGASAVVLNVTAVQPTAETHLTTWPTGELRPNSSSLNTPAGVTRAVTVVVRPGAGGHVSVRNNSGTTALVVDVVGWFDDEPEGAGDAFRPLDPARLLDTRVGIGRPGSTPVGAGAEVVLDIAGSGGVPPVGATTVALNLTAVGPSTDTHLTVWPGGEARPHASSLNAGAGRTTANLVIAKVGTDGTVRIRNNAGTTHILADVTGWWGPGAGPGPDGGLLHPMGPVRILDTRKGLGATGSVADVSLDVAGRGGLPPDPGKVRAVVVTLTAVPPIAVGGDFHVSAWPSGSPYPGTSTLNVSRNATTANLAVVPVGPDGRIILRRSQPADLVADVVGWIG